MIVLDHLSPAQRRAYVIADNRIAEDAGWDMALLAEEIGDLDAVEFDLDAIGFEKHELDALLADGLLADGRTRSAGRARCGKRQQRR